MKKIIIIFFILITSDAFSFQIDEAREINQDSLPILPTSPYVVGIYGMYNRHTVYASDYPLQLDIDMKRWPIDKSQNDLYATQGSNSLSIGGLFSWYQDYEDDKNVWAINTYLGYERQSLELIAQPHYYVKALELPSPTLSMQTESKIAMNLNVFSVESNVNWRFPVYNERLFIYPALGGVFSYRSIANCEFTEAVTDVKEVTFNEKHEETIKDYHGSFEFFENGGSVAKIQNNTKEFKKRFNPTITRFGIVFAVGSEYFFPTYEGIDLGLRFEIKGQWDVFSQDFNSETKGTRTAFQTRLALLYVINN